MTNHQERQLMRLLHGELPPEEARRLEQELERDSELRAAYRQMTRAWDSLELPESVLPADFSSSVVAAARQLATSELSWSLAPAWARGGATAALLTGLLIGVAFGRGFETPGVQVADGEIVHIADAEVADTDFDTHFELEADAVPLSLAEVYWLSLEESGGLLTEESSEGTP